jgi:hypothetical protein
MMTPQQTELFDAFISKYFDQDGNTKEGIPHDDLVRFLQVYQRSSKTRKPRTSVKNVNKKTSTVVRKAGDEPLAVTLLKKNNLWKKEHKHLSSCYIDAWCGGKVKNPQTGKSYRYFSTFKECYDEGVRLNKMNEGYVGGITMTKGGFDLRKSYKIKMAKRPDETSGLCAWSFKLLSCYSELPEPWKSPFDNEQSTSETEESSQEEEQEQEEVITPSAPSPPPPYIDESNEEETQTSTPLNDNNESDTEDQCDVYSINVGGNEFYVAEEYDGNIYDLSSQICGDINEKLHKYIEDEYKKDNIVELNDCDPDDYKMY